MSEANPSMYGIRYMASKGLHPGYSVKLERRFKTHQKWFSALQYGSLDAALIAAKAWRDEIALTLPGFAKQEFVSKLRPNNTSGCAGVVRTTRRSRQANGSVWSCDYWVARPPRHIKAPQRLFSISRYGEQRAWELAVAAREAFVALCEGYHLCKTPDALLPAVETMPQKSA